MYDFKRSNKLSGVHWPKKPVENLRIKVKLKPHDGIMLLPKFEDYTNDSNNVQLDTLEKIEEHEFSWQEKTFSLWELNRYSDVHNCTTDVELCYNNLLSCSDNEASKVHTYVHEDYHLPLPLENIRRDISEGKHCLERLNLTKKIKNPLTTSSSSMGHLFKSDEHLDCDESWKAMHVVLDNSEYNVDSQVVYKQEAILLSLYYNKVNNCLLVTPDCNDLEMNPYSLETSSGLELQYKYSVEITFQNEDEDSAEDLLNLLTKLGKKWEKKNKDLVNFSMPPLGKKEYHVAVEIMSALDFEMDDLYVEFNIKMPEGIECSGPLKGRTSVTEAMTSEDCKEWHFGHPIELALQADATADPHPMKFFMEVISIDWWGRHRTEGYSYLPLTLEPGCHHRTLSCSRPEERNRVEAENRRFFVGGCHLIKDLDVLVQPQLQQADFVYRSTGSIHLRWSVISQSPIRGYTGKAEGVASARPTTSASALLRGAEAVLRQYRRARAKLAAATKDLQGEGDGDGDDSDG